MSDIDPAPTVRIPGGRFRMGSDEQPEEGPVREVAVAGFLLEAAPVTNRRFGVFVRETGYVTEAERHPEPERYPGADPATLVPGALVFTPGPVPWAWVPGADWRHPLGPGSHLDGLDDHPVVQVSAADAEAYARWAGRRLPTEAEWEYAARGGLDGRRYAWGDEALPEGRPFANYWQGTFPFENRLDDGWLRTSPVGGFPPNGYGLSDMIGNVWEWTADWFTAPGHACCAGEESSADPGDPFRLPRRVLKGGSHLCADNYCARYRPAARIPQAIDSATCHVGFRCAADLPVDGAEPRLEGER